MSQQNTYTTTSEAGAVRIDGAGLVWPDTEDNRKLGRTTRCTLTDAEAARFGDRLTRLDDGAKATTAKKTKPAAATKTK